ncbi:MAG: hypothetical protein ACE5LD_00620 [Candidatus Bipolaricaulia bacterium]
MPTCAYCGRAKGTRRCPALGGHICTRCCGEHRGIEIDCPPTCSYYQRHEGYRRERLGPEFRKRWLIHNEGLYRGGEEKELNFILFLELLIYRYYRERTRGTDEEILEGLEFAKRQLGPLVIVEGLVRPDLGEYLLEGIEDYLEEYGLNEEEARAGVEATISFLKEFSGEDENPRRYLQGLMGHVEQDFNLPKEEEEAEAPSGLIITPYQLREGL